MTIPHFLFRYDVRNKLEDKSQFGVKSILPYRMSAKERELEEELDKERYLALYCDDLRVEEQEGESVCTDPHKTCILYYLHVCTLPHVHMYIMYSIIVWSSCVVECIALLLIN